MKDQHKPPQWATRFFNWFCNDHLREAVLGDLLDLYERRISTSGKKRADLLFIWNVFQFLQPFALRKQRASSPINYLTMHKNYFTVAWRNMTGQKMHTSIKIGGFALGLATCIVITLFIRHELSYDRHYENTDRIYRVYNEMLNTDVGKWTAVPAPFAQQMKSNIPEIELAARLIPYNWFNAGNNLMRRDDQPDNIYEEGFAYADPELLEILEIPMVYGNRTKALKEPNTIVLSKKMADKYFSGEDPVGKILILNDDKKQPFTVGGVMENFTATSHLQYDFFITLAGKEFWQGEQTSWCCWNYNPYIRVPRGTDPVALEAKITEAMKKIYVAYLTKEKNQELDDVKKHYRIRLQSVADIHLYSDGIDDIIPHGDIRYVWMFGGIAVFILALASINFINLSTAKSANRAKEVGLRKVVGSYRSSLITQFLSESVLYSILSFLLALAILGIGLPYFNHLAGIDLVIPWAEWWFLPSMVVAALLIGVIAGLYPSFYLSAFKPVDVLKGSIARGMKNSKLRGAMVVFQFTASIVLIIGTFVIYKQMNYILTAKIGYDKEQVIMIQGINTVADQQTFKNELLDLASVKNVTITQYLPVMGTKRDMNSFWREGKSQEEKSIGAQVWWVDLDYISTMGMKLVEGRNFENDRASDSTAMIINQAMAKEFGFKKPVGERIMNWRTWNVIGVVEDFHFENMKGPIQPLCFVRGYWGSIAAVKVNAGKMDAALESITAVWKKFMPHQPIRYTFLDESYARMYDDVRRTGNILASFAILAIIVACLGLFALSSFMAEQRAKEISIRLVLGASLSNIFRLLTNQFIALVLIAFVLAVPLSWYAMEQWLKDYEYRTDIGWQVFVIAGALSVIIAMLTISYQSIRAALANPAEKLRSE